MNEIDYERGNRQAWASILSECLRHLGYESPETEYLTWVAERESAISALREVCEYHGDNDWDETLHLADIIDKHLLKHLEKK